MNNIGKRNSAKMKLIKKIEDGSISIKLHSFLSFKYHEHAIFFVLQLHPAYLLGTNTLGTLYFLGHLDSPSQMLVVFGI